MMVRVRTLRFNPVLCGFNNTPLRDCFEDKDVLSVCEPFFVKHATPYLAVLGTYTLPQPYVSPPPAAARRQLFTDSLHVS